MRDETTTITNRDDLPDRIRRVAAAADRAGWDVEILRHRSWYATNDTDTHDFESISVNAKNAHRNHWFYVLWRIANDRARFVSCRRWTRYPGSDRRLRTYRAVFNEIQFYA